MDSKYLQTWDSPIPTSPRKKSEIPIIHVIGLVGAGKSAFIQKYFPNLPIFDIKDIYQTNNFTPQDLHNNPDSYLQFQSALEYSFEGFYQNLKETNKPIGIVESSGINKGLNAILKKFFVYRIWITPDFKRMQAKKIYVKQPYAKNLNEHMLALYKYKKIIYNTEFNFTTYDFSKRLPPIIKKYFN
uniref:Zeta toxin n=1 Tax=Promethearchaeum syntrophicum TaxID=2594042 RepID=A0A5B9DG83_9ARCH|nr:hypothetical protein DSAG12_03608 [Candidatus Prometheoarchaeum syntrophicum]